MKQAWMLWVLAVALMVAGCDRLGIDLGGKSKASEDDEVSAKSEGEDDDARDEKKSKAKKKKSDDDEPTVETAAPPPPEAPETDLFSDVTPATDALKQKVGGAPVRALKLIVYPGYAFLEAQDPKKKENVDEYEFRGGVSGPKPVRLIGDPTLGELETNLFSLDEVDFKKLPALIEETKKRLGYEDGKVSHAILKRNLPFDSGVQWRIYLTSPRKSGSVTYDPSGKMLRELR